MILRNYRKSGQEMHLYEYGFKDQGATACIARIPKYLWIEFGEK